MRRNLEGIKAIPTYLSIPTKLYMSCSKYYLSLFESQIRVQHVYNIVFYNTKASLYILLWLLVANFFGSTLQYFLHSLIHNKHERFYCIIYKIYQWSLFITCIYICSNETIFLYPFLGNLINIKEKYNIHCLPQHIYLFINCNQHGKQ